MCIDEIYFIVVYFVVWLGLECIYVIDNYIGDVFEIIDEVVFDWDMKVVWLGYGVDVWKDCECQQVLIEVDDLFLLYCFINELGYLCCLVEVNVGFVM